MRAYAGDKGTLTFEQFFPRYFGPPDVGILSARSLFLLFSNEAAGPATDCFSHHGNLLPRSFIAIILSECATGLQQIVNLMWATRASCLVVVVCVRRLSRHG